MQVDANLITVKDLRANNILSGTLKLKTTEHNGSFVLDSTYQGAVIIDGTGIKVTAADGATVHIKTTEEGISAKTNTTAEYFKLNPSEQETVMSKGKIIESLQFSSSIKIIQSEDSHGIAFIGLL